MFPRFFLLQIFFSLNHLTCMLNILTAPAKILTNVYSTFVYSTFLALSPKDPKSPEKVAAKALQPCGSGDTIDVLLLRCRAPWHLSVSTHQIGKNK